MAERRMFTKKVTDDDNFMALSASAQALYLHLSMSADDDGFCNQVSTSMFKAHASVQDLQALLEKRYIYQFENGVIVIKHWRMANALRKDRYTPTAFKEELAQLQLKDNGSYTWLPDGCQVVAKWLPQDRLGKDRLDKDSVDTSSNDDMSVSDEKDAVVSDTKSLKTEIETVIKAWNNTTFKPVSRLGSNTNRYTWLQARLREYGLDAVLEAINNAEESEYLHSDKASWFNFEWFIRPNNFPKVLERNYNNNKTPASNNGIDWNNIK